MLEATMDELMKHIEAGGKLRRGMTRDDLLGQAPQERMTVEEAIRELTRMSMNLNITRAESNALELAIKALEKVEVWNGIGGKQVVAPKGTFEAIYNEDDDDNQDDV